MKMLAVMGLLVLGILVISFTSQPVFAGENDILIKKLVDKKILTPPEAKEVLKEVESKKFDLPKGLKGISVGGTYFLEYYSKDYDDDANNDDFNSFAVQRTYLTVKKKFVPWFSTRITADITHDSSRTTEIGWEFRLKYAYGKFDFKKLSGKDLRLESEVGLVHTASDDYDAALWPYRPQGKHFLDRYSIMSSADYGINMRLTLGDIGKDFKKRVSKKYAGKWGGIWAGVYNGAGYSHAEVNAGKVVEALVYVRPLNKIDKMKGLRIGYHVMRGESNKLLSGGAPKEYADWEINQYMVSYQHESFTVMGQLYEGKGEDLSSDQNDRDGYSIRAFARMPFNKKLRIFARYDLYDDNDNLSNYDEKTTIYGASYDLLKGLMPWLAVENKYYDSGLGKDDYKMYQVGLAIKL